MASPFAAIESRINDSVFKHLANREATLNGVTVSGIFDDAYSAAMIGDVGMENTQPMFTLKTSLVIGDPVGQTITIDGIGYMVANHRPDGSGVSRLLLEYL